VQGQPIVNRDHRVAAATGTIADLENDRLVAGGLELRSNRDGRL
jgi:hypothetical protein